jgi:hypothetical protein
MLFRLTVSALAGVVLSARVASAQVPAPDISKQIIGTWQGPYQSESVPPGSLKLVIAHDATGWKVTMDVISDQPPPVGDIKDFTVDKGTLSWSQDIQDMNCKSTATLVSGVLKGSAECSQGGAVVLTATFLLEKKA